MTSEVWIDEERVIVPAGDAASFDEYVSTNQARLVRYAALLCGSATQGEDLVQSVLTRLYPRWGRLADPDPYVRRSITNEFLSWRRLWSTRHIQPADVAALDIEVTDPWLDGPDPHLWALLERLPRQQRAAVVLRYYEGYDDTAIGELLNCKAATVRGHISRGLATLRAALAGAHSEDPAEEGRHD